MKYYLSILLVVACCSTVMADVRVPRIFGDNMILQQQTKNAVWGWAKPGEMVTIKASWGATASATAGDDGRWKLFLDTPQHGTGHSLTVAGKNTIQINNVAIGEVWLCAGQSNMGWSMDNSFEAEKEADVDLPNFRIFRSEREHWHEPLEENRDRLARWKPCDPKSAAETSAVSYYFGKTLHEHLGVPVGIIQRAYAGTPIEGWMPWEIQMDDSRAVADKKILDQLAARRAAGRGPTREQALAAFEKELAEYNALIDAGAVMKNPFKQLGPPIITAPSNLGHQYPAHMFNAMVYPIRPFGIRGIIWYQGERNAKDAAQAEHYREQLARLIGYYRESWHELSEGGTAKEFPFQFTQLPSWHPPQSQPVEGVQATWAVSREAMRLVSCEVPNADMVVSIDTGDSYALHPKNKKPIGIRHALLALANTYEKDIVGSGPRFRSMEVDGAQLRLRFESADSGLMTARSGPPDAFAIAGEDRQWHWAQAEIEDDSVVLSASEVRRPVAARYAWAMNPSQRNLLYNREGLPASPFRTDDWPLFDPAAEPIEVDKPEVPSGYQAVDWMRPEMTQASGLPRLRRNSPR